MTQRRLLIAPLLLLAALAIAHADDKKPAPAAAAPAEGAAAAPKFNHATHGAKVKGFDFTKCEQCHATATDGTLIKPGHDGHKPCMTSGCHLSKEAPLGFLAKDSKICLGCHASSDNYRKNPPSQVFKGNPKPEHYFEFNHKGHMEQKVPGTSDPISCTDCHTIDKATFAAVEHPAHPQCARCHAEGKSSVPMNKCDTCHPAGDPADHLTKKRKDANIRPGAFTHEHVGHRFLDKEAMTQPLECKFCHRVVASATNLDDLHGEAIINTDSMNNACAKCHNVKDTEQCTKCHTEAIKANSFGFVHGM